MQKLAESKIGKQGRKTYIISQDLNQLFVVYSRKKLIDELTKHYLKKHSKKPLHIKINHENGKIFLGDNEIKEVYTFPITERDFKEEMNMWDKDNNDQT